MCVEHNMFMVGALISKHPDHWGVHWVPQFICVQLMLTIHSWHYLVQQIVGLVQAGCDQLTQLFGIHCLLKCSHTLQQFLIIYSNNITHVMYVGVTIQAQGILLVTHTHTHITYQKVLLQDSWSLDSFGYHFSVPQNKPTWYPPVMR